MFGSSTYGRSSDPSLCLCEYYDHRGERNHILACCCDCEALDIVCDRILTCRKVESDVYNRMWKTIMDRLRIPSFSGKGAIRVHPDVAVPAVLVPGALLLATINQYFTILMLTGLPLAIFLHYRLWKKRQARGRTRLFYMWGLISVFTMMAVFLGILTQFREVLLWEIMTQVTLFGILMYFWVQIRKDPGVLRKARGMYNHPRSSKIRLMPQGSSGTVIDVEDEKKDETTQNEFSSLLNSYSYEHKDAEGDLDESERMEKEKCESLSIHENKVKWVDSRPFSENGFLETWCKTCQVKKVARSGHCPVCATCVIGRDHHCVWVDNCIGARNHRAFFLGLLTLVINGFYGAHLALTTVCTPTMYYDWFLLPNNCNLVYADQLTALTFVSACYAIIFCSFMLFLLLEQFLLISQNLTSQELHRASLRGWATFCIARNNINNKGFVSNWMDFLSGRRASRQQYGTMEL